MIAQQTAGSWVTPANPRSVPDFLSRAAGHDRLRTAIALTIGTILIAAVLFMGPIPGPTGLLLVALGIAAAAWVLGSPTVAVLVLLVASFTRLAVPPLGLPAEPMVLALAALFAGAVLAAARGSLRYRFGFIEAAMVAYVVWNIGSMLLPHEFPAAHTTRDEPIVVYRFILSGTVLPFVAYVVGRAAFRTERAARPALYLIVAMAGYSGVVSIMQFTGPTQLVWPSYIVDAPNWPERACGIFNQPVVNGLVMVAGFVTAMFLVQQRDLSRFPRLMSLLVVLLCIPGIYLTRTRAVWLVWFVGMLICAIFARGVRRGFLATIAGGVGFVVWNWSTFTSADREAGGVGSSSELNDRLNSIATSLWAIEQKPLFGWGIGRYEAVNTYYHQQYAPSIDYARGYAIASHENELGIATELGLIGLALWFAVLVPIIWQVLRLLRRLPVHGMGGRPLGLLTLTVLGTWIVCGFTVDLRFFDFANLLTFLMLGIVFGVGDALAARSAAGAAPGPAPDQDVPTAPFPRQLAGANR